MNKFPGVDIRPWVYGDLAKLELREPDRTDMEGIDKDALVAGYDGPKKVICMEGKVIGAFGYRKCDASASLWGMVSDELGKCPLLLCRVLRWLIHRAQADGCFRIDCLVAEGYELSARWLCRYGLRYEGTIHCCPPNGKNRWLMAWWRGMC